MDQATATATQAAQAQYEATGYHTGFSFKGVMMTEEEFKNASFAAAHPYYVYYRTSRSKGIKHFATRAAQCRFINTAPRHYAITAWN